MTKPITAFNIVYPSCAALAADFNLDRQLVYTRIKTHKWSPEKAVLTEKHGSIRKSYTDHPFLLKSPLLFKVINKARESVQRIKSFKEEVVKLYSKRIKIAKKAFRARSKGTVIPKGHGRYSLGRFKAEPALANHMGCIYLALIPLKNGSFYLKIGISKHLNASKRSSSLPKGTKILNSKNSELHRCFQTEQLMLEEFKEKGLEITKYERFDGYTEVLTLLSAKASIDSQYFRRLKKLLKDTKDYKEFIKNSS